MTETRGEEIVLEWHDGPISSITRIDFYDSEAYAARREIAPVVEVRAFVAGEVGIERGLQIANVRMDRETLQAALDLLDGKDVADWRSR